MRRMTICRYLYCYFEWDRDDAGSERVRELTVHDAETGTVIKFFLV